MRKVQVLLAFAAGLCGCGSGGEAALLVPAAVLSVAVSATWLVVLTVLPTSVVLRFSHFAEVRCESRMRQKSVTVFAHADEAV